MGVPLTDEQLDQLLSYYELLAEANKHMNLTAIDDLEGVITRHFLDSFGALCVSETDADGMNVGGQGKERGTDRLEKYLPDKLKKPEMSLIDVGTGAGFPGLPLAIMKPDAKVLLLDSLQKRIGFLGEVITGIGLENTMTEHNRAEDGAKAHREAFDRAVSRAVANLSTLSEYCLPFVKVGGYFIAYKSGNVEAEVKDAANAVRILGGTVERIETYSLSNGDPRSLVFIRKIAPTPKKYPRKAGTPQKTPLK